VDEQTYMDFITALGEEYCEVVSPLAGHGAEPHDGYEVFAKMYGANEISPEKLHAASDTEVERLRDISREWHESERIGTGHIREVIRRTLCRWPPGVA
jgi:ABC-type Zn uptake system ZnuABC Zn-binding protein ZnuA